MMDEKHINKQKQNIQIELSRKMQKNELTSRTLADGRK